MCLSFRHGLSKPRGTLLLSQVFSRYFCFGAERILRGLSRLTLVQWANKGWLLLPQKGFIITADTGKKYCLYSLLTEKHNHLEYLH